MIKPLPRIIDMFAMLVSGCYSCYATGLQLCVCVCVEGMFVCVHCVYLCVWNFVWCVNCVYLCVWKVCLFMSELCVFVCVEGMLCV